MLEEFEVDLLHQTADMFCIFNPSFKNMTDKDLETYLNEEQNVIIYYVQQHPPPGRRPAIFLVLNGFPGNFMALPDRHYEGENFYQVNNYNGLIREFEGEPNAASVRWVARHLTMPIDHNVYTLR